MSADRPLVVVHTAVSLDGVTTGFDIDIGTYYELARTFGEDASLTGADTILESATDLTTAPVPGPNPDGPILAVVDSRSRVTEWEALTNSGYWSQVIPLRGTTGKRVDLAAALTTLASDYGVKIVRVDSGGALTGALLTAGLVDQISLLVHPVLVGDGPRWYGNATSIDTTLELEACEKLPGGLVWLRYGLRE